MSSPTSNPTNGVLAPVSVDAFFSGYWEQRPLHISRDSADYFGELLSADLLKEQLLQAELYFPGLQLTQSGRQIAAAEYAHDNHHIRPKQLLDLHAEGATIVWAKIHETFASVRTYCRELQFALNMTCLANAYLSPSAKQGFNPHYDSHDVFIAQVSGRKTFRFYNNGVELPFSHERFDSKWHQAGDQTEAIELTAGDTLYIPRGVMHDAVAADDETSLHITFGVYPTTAKDLLQHVIENAADSDIDLRRSIPLGADLSKLSETLLNNVLSSANHSEFVINAIDDLHEKLAFAAIPGLPDDGVLNVQCGEVVEVISNRVVNVRRINDITKLRLYGKVLEFEEPLASAVEWLFTEAEGAVLSHAIHGLSDNQSLALCKQLIQEQVVRLVK